MIPFPSNNPRQVYPLVDIFRVLVYGYDSRLEEGIKPPHRDR